MNNTINSLTNVSFNSRYLNLKQMESLPPSISEAIYKNDAIDAFLKKGEPKTFLEKIMNFFRKDEILDVILDVSKIKLPLAPEESITERLQDPFQKVESLIFRFNKRNGKKKVYELSSEQRGIKRAAGSIPKKGEHYAYKPPIETAEEKLVIKINDIKDLGSLLK